MRKTLLGIVCTALATSLFAEREYISGTGFEGWTRGTSPKPEYKEGSINLLKTLENSWYCWGSTDGTDDSAGEGCATVMAYGSQAKPEEVDLPANADLWQTNGTNAYYSAGTNTKYLEIDSGSTLLARKISVPSDIPEIGDAGIYIDTKVQFSVADQATQPQAGDGDKLLLWLSDNSDTGVTNLMVMAGLYEDAIYSTKTYTIPVDCVSISEEKWYRLTIVAEMHVYIKGDDAEHDTSTARFRIYIDGKKIEADDGTEAFLSMIKSQDPNYEKITAIGFTGHGCVDDIVFATESPYERTPISYSIYIGEGVASFDYEIQGEGGEVVDSGRGVSDTLEITDSKYNRKTIIITNVVYENGYLRNPNSTTSGIISDDGSFTIIGSRANFEVVADGVTTNCVTMTEVAGAISNKAEVAIKLLGAYTLEGDENLIVPKDMAVTLDLNGCELVCTNAGKNIIVVSGAGSSLFLKDSKGNGVVRYADGVELSNRRVISVNASVLSVTIGKKETDSFMLCSAPVYIPATYKGSLTINGGKFEFLPRKGSADITDYKGICPRGWTLGKASDTDEYFTLQPTGDDGEQEVSADDVAATKYDTEEAAQTAAEGIVIVAPNAVSLTSAENQTYSTYVEAKVVESDGKYVINAVFKEDKVEELQQVADGAAEAALAVADGGQVVVNPAVPGLYYTLEQGDDLPLDEGEPRLVGTGEKSVTFTVEKDAAQGFYRIKISPTK